MDGKMKNFTRELEPIKKNPMEMGELKNTQTEIKNSIHGFDSHVDPVEKRINKLQHVSRKYPDQSMKSKRDGLHRKACSWNIRK